MSRRFRSIYAFLYGCDMLYCRTGGSIFKISPGTDNTRSCPGGSVFSGSGMLKGDLDQVRQYCKEIIIIPEQKRILAAALGLMYPEVRQHCYEITGIQNFDKEFPYAYINRIIAGKI